MGDSTLALVVVLLLVVVAAIWWKRPGAEGFSGGLLGGLAPARELAAARASLGSIEKLAAFTDFDAEFPEAGPFGKMAALKVRRANNSARLVVVSVRRLSRVLAADPGPAKLRGLADGLRGSSELFRAAAERLTSAGSELQQLAATSVPMSSGPAEGGPCGPWGPANALEVAGARLVDLGACVHRLDAHLRALVAKN